VEQKEWRNKCTKYFSDLIGYKQGMKFPTVFFRKMKEMDGYGYDVIYKTFLYKDTELNEAVRNKAFQTEYNKVAYLMAIVQNSIADVYKITTVQKTSEDVNIPDVEDVANVKQKRRDISAFIGDTQ